MIDKRSFLGIPMGRRRWPEVAYWTFAILLTLEAIALLTAHPQGSQALQIIRTSMFIVASFALGGMVWDTSFTPEKASGGIGTLFDSTFRARSAKNAPRNEEPDQREWDWAHTKAYALLSLIALFNLPWQFWQLLPSNGQLRQPMILFLFLVVLTLPQSILFWSEPDLEDPDEN